jgi:hypothetical protein
MVMLRLKFSPVNFLSVILRSATWNDNFLRVGNAQSHTYYSLRKI